MFVVILIMFFGVALGFALRGHEKVNILSSRMLMPLIYLLLFAMGVIVGTNEEIISNLSTLGLRALVITIGAVFGSVLMARLVWVKFMRKDEQ